MQLIARWHGTPQGRLLQAWRREDASIIQEDAEKQFFDTITKLSESQRFGEREERCSVMQKSYSELTDEESLARALQNIAASLAFPRAELAPQPRHQV